MATYYPFEEYTEEQYLDKDIAAKRQELADLQFKVNELREVLDAAPEAVVYGLRLNAEGEYFNPIGEITWVKQ
jgi:hypothetical protein